MRPTRLQPREDESAEVLATDRYLEALLASAGGRGAEADRVPGPAAQTAPPDAGLRRAATVLRSSLVRVHPSFLFEERLAGRLRALSAGGLAEALAVPGRRGGALLRFPGLPPAAAADGDPLLGAVLDGRLDPADEAAVARASRGPAPSRPLIVGGAITSAAISLAGVAWVAWRASRTGLAPADRVPSPSRAPRAAAPAGRGDLATGAPGSPA